MNRICPHCGLPQTDATRTNGFLHRCPGVWTDCAGTPILIQDGTWIAAIIRDPAQGCWRVLWLGDYGLTLDLWTDREDAKRWAMQALVTP